jgi:hypothetical protein
MFFDERVTGGYGQRNLSGTCVPGREEVCQAKPPGNLLSVGVRGKDKNISVSGGALASHDMFHDLIAPKIFVRTIRR